MLHMLSIPTWFLTLSAADLHCPEMIQAVAVQFGKILTQKDVLKMSIADRSKYLCQNPITGVWMFQQTWGILLWIPAQWYTPTRSYQRLCNKNWIPDEKITSCPFLAVGQRCSKNRQRSRWHCLCFHWQIHHSNDTCINIRKWTSHQTHGQLTKTYTFWLLLQKQILLFQFSKTTSNKNYNILTTTWWSGQNCKKCKITTTDCTKCTYNNKCS